MPTITVTERLDVVSCPTCGVTYAIPDHLRAQAERDPRRTSVWCPAGHCWHYLGEDMEQRARAAEARAFQAEAALRTERTRRKSIEQQAARLRKRTANGVCPCCHRSFVQLARHMKAKHPDYSS